MAWLKKMNVLTSPYLIGNILNPKSLVWILLVHDIFRAPLNFDSFGKRDLPFIRFDYKMSALY